MNVQRNTEFQSVIVQILRIVSQYFSTQQVCFSLCTVSTELQSILDLDLQTRRQFREKNDRLFKTCFELQTHCSKHHSMISFYSNCRKELMEYLEHNKEKAEPKANTFGYFNRKK